MCGRSASTISTHSTNLLVSRSAYEISMYVRFLFRCLFPSTGSTRRSNARCMQHGTVCAPSPCVARLGAVCRPVTARLPLALPSLPLAQLSSCGCCTLASRRAAKATACTNTQKNSRMTRTHTLTHTPTSHRHTHTHARFFDRARQRVAKGSARKAPASPTRYH